MPTEAEDFASELLSFERGRIAACNIVDGVILGHYNDQFAKSIFAWWSAWAVQKDERGEDALACLRFLKAFHRGEMLTEFVPPAVTLDNPWISCPRPPGLGASDIAATVRTGSDVPKWADLDDLALMSGDVDFTASPGQVSYSRSLRAAGRTPDGWKLRVADGKTITPPAPPRDVVVFFTCGTSLRTSLQALPHDEWADLVRDRLGLVHRMETNALVAISFDANLAEARSDRGRPTVIDAGAHPRFMAATTDAVWEPNWGRAADLGGIAGGQLTSAMPERVCGPLPPNGLNPLPEITVHFLGAPVLPRGDHLGALDAEFANALQQATLDRARNTPTFAPASASLETLVFGILT